MKILIVIVAVLTQGDEAKFVLKEGGFRSMAECQEREDAAHDPRLVCAETPAWWVYAP